MPKKPPSLRERQAQLTRDEILKAARRLFAERGYTRTSVRDIAEAAGVSAQTVYDSIGSKQALVARLNDLIDDEAGIAAIAGAAIAVERSGGGGGDPAPRSPGRSSSTAATSSMRSSPGRRPNPTSQAALAEGHRRHVDGRSRRRRHAPRTGCARSGGRRATRRPTPSPRSPTSGSRSCCARATAGRSTASRSGSPPRARRSCCHSQRLGPRPTLDRPVKLRLHSPLMTTIDKDALKREVRRGAGQAAAARRQRPVPAAERPARPLPRRPVHARSPSGTPKTDHVTVAFIGGGFAGLVTGARLKEAGVDDVRIIEKGGDFGGTWYWNRYPGAQCDTASLRVHAAARRDRPHADREVRARARDPRALPAHRQAVRPLRQRAVPHRGHRPRVGRRASRAGSSAPTGATSSPPSSSRMGTGPLHVPKLPGHPRHRGLPRATRSTPAGGTTTTPAATRPARRWTSWPTSGSPSSAPARPRCSACRTSPRACRELYVFQRTPSSVDVRDNRPTDPEWFAEIATPGWQQRWLENFTANQTGGDARRGPRDGRLDRPRPPDPRARSWRCRPRSSRPRA